MLVLFNLKNFHQYFLRYSCVDNRFSQHLFNLNRNLLYLHLWNVFSSCREFWVDSASSSSTLRVSFHCLLTCAPDERSAFICILIPLYGMSSTRFTQTGYFENIHLYHWFLATWTTNPGVFFSGFYSAWDLLSFWNPYTEVVLVIYYGITNYPRTQWLKTRRFTVYDSSDLWSSVSGSLPRLYSKCWQGLQSAQYLSGEGSVSKLTLWLLAVGLTASVIHWLLVEGYPQFFVHESSRHGRLLYWNKKARRRREFWASQKSQSSVTQPLKWHLITFIIFCS